MFSLLISETETLIQFQSGIRIQADHFSNKSVVKDSMFDLFRIRYDKYINS